MILKLFTKPDCVKCPAAKKVVKEVEHKVTVENHDITTEDGLTEALQYDVMSTPSIIVLNHDNDVVGEWRGEAPSLEVLNSILK